MRNTFFYLLILFPTFSFAQSFHLKRTSAKEVPSIQATDNAKPTTKSYSIGISDDYFPNRRDFKLAQPIIYSRLDSNFSFEIQYFFSLPDSTIRLIEYEWEGNNETTEEDFFWRVNKNKDLISNLLGQPKKTIPATDEKAAKSIWYNDDVHVAQFYIPELMRIRVLISWK